MSPKSLRWKYRAWHLAMTVGSVSCLQLMGCLNNPTRSDLASEAGKAALIAEEDLTQQRIQHAEQIAAQTQPETDRVVLASGEFPAQEQETSIVQVGAEVEAAEKAPAKKSFWSFLTPKPKKPPLKDPFADHPELKSETRAQAKTDTKTNTPPAAGKARLASSSVAVPDAKSAEKDAFSPENWFEKELASQPAPSWAAISENSPAFDGKPSGKIPEKAADASSPFDKVDQPVASAKKPIAESAWIPQKSDNEKRDFVEESVPEWAMAGKASTRSPEKQPAETASPKGTFNSLNSLAMRQQKLRIQALMSEAHTCSLRGELHAAYRCALLAEKIAEEGQVAFEKGEETPQEFARALAGKLWRTSNSSEESYLAATEAGSAVVPASGGPVNPLPASTQGSPSHVVANSPFPQGTFATWQPVADSRGQHQVAVNGKPSSPGIESGTQAGAIASRESSASSGRDPSTSPILPEIRPWPNERPVQNGVPPREFSGTTAMAPATPVQSSTDDAATSSSAEQKLTSNDRGVQFAIAHEVQEEKSPHLLDPFSTSGHGERMASASMDQQRPVLLAPPVPAERSSQSAVDSTLTWEQLSRSRNAENGAQASESGWSWRMIWSVLGLISTGLCTAAGVWYSRRQSSDESQPDKEAGRQMTDSTSSAVAGPALEIMSDSSAANEEPEVQPLQFKRVA